MHGQVWTNDPCGPAWPSANVTAPPVNANTSCTTLGDLMAAMFVCDNAPANHGVDLSATCTNACIANLIACIDNPLLAMVFNDQEVQNLRALSRCCASPAMCHSNLVPLSLANRRVNAAATSSCHLSAANFSICPDLGTVTKLSDSTAVAATCTRVCVQEMLSCAANTASLATWLDVDDMARLNAVALCCSAPALCASLGSATVSALPASASASTTNRVCNIGYAALQLASCTHLIAPRGESQTVLCSTPCIVGLLDCVNSPMLAIMANASQLQNLQKLVTIC